MWSKLLMMTLILGCMSVDVYGNPIVFDNGAVDPAGDAFLSETPPSGLVAIAENFRLGKKTNIGKLVWTGAVGGRPRDVDFFTIRIFEDLGGIPDQGNVVLNRGIGAVARAELGVVNGGGLAMFEYRANIERLNIELMPNVVYWLSISNVPLPSTSWGWQESLGAPSSLEHFAGQTRGESWLSSSRIPQYAGIQFAFRVLPVPEPNTPSLLILAALACLVTTLRRRSAGNDGRRSGVKPIANLGLQ